MKVIDNREQTLAQKAKVQETTGIRVLQDKWDKERENEREIKRRTLNFRLVGPIMNEFEYYFGGTLAVHLEIEAHRKFAHKAILEFEKTSEIILEAFDEPQWNSTRIELELPNQKFKNFSETANKLGISVTDFAQSLIYTKIKNMNDAKRAEREAYEAKEEANKRYRVDEVWVSKATFAQLKAEYGDELPPELKNMYTFTDRPGEWVAQALEDYYKKKSEVDKI